MTSDKSMDQVRIAGAAQQLEHILNTYAQGDAEVRSLKNALTRLIERAKGREISSPLSWADIPGGYLFTEGNLGKYKDLEEAFATFRIEVTGRRDLVTQLMKDI